MTGIDRHATVLVNRLPKTKQKIIWNPRGDCTVENVYPRGHFGNSGSHKI